MTERSVQLSDVEQRDAAAAETATWDERADADVELLGEPEPVDEVDPVEAAWAPGEGSPGVPADEVLHVHPDADPTLALVDELELDDVVHDELALAEGELFEGEEGEA
ncbi:MAG: hypothetical protein ACXVJ7_16755 [Acidimicrobiia bacterium]